jgi:hypothetical protein
MNRRRRRRKESLVCCWSWTPSGPWSVAEVERELGEHIATVDAVASLQAAGLVHRCGEFVFATRAALCMDRLSL